MLSLSFAPPIILPLFSYQSVSCKLSLSLVPPLPPGPVRRVAIFLLIFTTPHRTLQVHLHTVHILNLVGNGTLHTSCTHTIPFRPFRFHPIQCILILLHGSPSVHYGFLVVVLVLRLSPVIFPPSSNQDDHYPYVFCFPLWCFEIP